MIASGNSISPNGNRRTLAILGTLVFGMVGLSYASVPLYELFCKVTGYAGTTQVADSGPAVGDLRCASIAGDFAEQFIKRNRRIR